MNWARQPFKKNYVWVLPWVNCKRSTGLNEHYTTPKQARATFTHTPQQQPARSNQHAFLSKRGLHCNASERRHETLCCMPGSLAHAYVSKRIPPAGLKRRPK
jgi:hypothetical protein